MAEVVKQSKILSKKFDVPREEEFIYTRLKSSVYHVMAIDVFYYLIQLKKIGYVLV